MKQAGFFLLLGMAFISCEKNPIPLVLHEPIYPSATQAVTYTAERVTGGSISNAKLYETVNTINSYGIITTSGTETLIQEWNNPSGDLSFTKPSGHGTNKLVSYRWVFTTPDQTKSFKVSYVTRPYPVSGMPAPVYAQGDPDDVFDLVFIPDTDVTSITTFYNHCRGAIRESFFDEPHSRFWRRQYNFYINTERGHATDYDRRTIDGPHQLPSNNANLSFAEGRALLHQNDLRDWASGGVFSTEMQNRGTILHEAGHALYSLADEYGGGSHWQEAQVPNNWSTLSGAQTAASGYGSCKEAADAVEMGSSGWYHLCVSNCQMVTTGLTRTEYDCPCKSRITYVVFDNASN